MKSLQNRPPNTKNPRTIAANIALTTTYVKKAVTHDAVISGGVR